jgi:hypothetical protein
MISIVMDVDNFAKVVHIIDKPKTKRHERN